MSQRIQVAVLCGVLLMSLIGGSLVAAAEPETSELPIAPEVGRRAPDFTLTTVDGRAVSLWEDLHGTPVILYFWATWCAICRADMPVQSSQFVAASGLEAAAWQEASPPIAPPEGYAFLAINVQEAEKRVMRQVESDGYQFPVLIDRNGQVGAKYRVVGVPTYIFIDADGIVQAKHIGGASQAEFQEKLTRIVR